MVTTNRVFGKDDDEPADIRYAHAAGFLDAVELVERLARARGIDAAFCRTLQRVGFESEGAVYDRLPMAELVRVADAAAG
jgi:hypothetical protein